MKSLELLGAILVLIVILYCIFLVINDYFPIESEHTPCKILSMGVVVKWAPVILFSNPRKETEYSLFLDGPLGPADIVVSEEIFNTCQPGDSGLYYNLRGRIDNEVIQWRFVK